MREWMYKTSVDEREICDIFVGVVIVKVEELVLFLLMVMRLPRLIEVVVAAASVV